MTRILVVDDYRPFLEEMQAMADGHTSVTTAESSRDALGKLGTAPFDLVITDLFMETQTAEDGLAVLRAAKKDAFTQVIVITAYGRPRLSVQTMELGAFDYLERGTAGIDFRGMLTCKIRLALEYRSARLAAGSR